MQFKVVFDLLNCKKSLAQTAVDSSPRLIEQVHFNGLKSRQVQGLVLFRGLDLLARGFNRMAGEWASAKSQKIWVWYLPDKPRLPRKRDEREVYHFDEIASLVEKSFSRLIHPAAFDRGRTAVNL